MAYEQSVTQQKSVIGILDRRPFSVWIVPEGIPAESLGRIKHQIIKPFCRFVCLLSESILPDVVVYSKYSSLLTDKYYLIVMISMRKNYFTVDTVEEN